MMPYIEFKTSILIGSDSVLLLYRHQAINLIIHDLMPRTLGLKWKWTVFQLVSSSFMYYSIF